MASRPIEHSDLHERLRRHVDMLAGVIGPRPPTKPAALHAAAAYKSASIAE